MCAAAVVLTPRIARIPAVEYAPDGTVIVTGPDGTSKLDDRNDSSSDFSSLDRPSKDNRPVDNGRVWNLAVEALQDDIAANGSSSEYRNGKALIAGHEAGESGRSGGSPRYKQRGINLEQQQSNEDSTVNSNNVSTASSSLLRRLRWRSRSRSTAKRSESDTEVGGGTKRRRHRGPKSSSSKRSSNGFSIDKPKKHTSDSDLRRKPDAVGRPEVAAGSAVIGQPQTTNAYWQEMINESRRRHKSNSPQPSPRSRQRKRNASSSPVTSRTRNRESTRSNDSSGAERSRFGRGPPRMTQEFAASLGRDQSLMTSDANSSRLSTASSQHTLVHVEEAAWTERRRHRDGSCLPGCSEQCVDRPCASGSALVVFGCLLVVVGVVRLLVCYWHEYGSSIWAGVPLLLFGFTHIMVGRKRLTSRLKMILYVVVGAVTSLALLAAAAVSLVVLVPVLNHVVRTSPISDVDANVSAVVNFSRYNADHTVTGVVAVTWPTVVLDLCSLLLIAVSLYTQTITTRAFDNYLDHVMNDDIGDWPSLSTSQRSRISSIDQTTVGQITIFVGFFEITFIEYLPIGHVSYVPHAWTTVWSGALLIIAGLISMLYDKASYSRTIGIVSAAAEVCSMLGCGATTILTTLVIAKDAEQLKTATSDTFSNLVAIVTVAAVSDCLSIVGLVFCIGILYRQLTRLCDCASINDRTSRRDGSPSSSRAGSVSGRHQLSRRMDNWQPSHVIETYELGTAQ